MAKIIPKSVLPGNSMVEPYDPSDDIIYYQKGKDYNEHAVFLAQRAVMAGGKFWIHDPSTHRWSEFGGRHAFRAALLTRWSGVHEGPRGPLVICRDAIDAYIADYLLVLDATTYAPMSGAMVTFRGTSKRLNLWQDLRLIGDDEDIVAATELMTMIRHSLCAMPGPEKSVEAMIEEINRGESVFSWVVQWLGAKYQNPAWIPQTNLWLCGPQRGIGKGTLLAILKRIFGAVNKVDINEIVKRSWMDTLYGALLCEWDEVAMREELGTLLKDKTGNEAIMIASRGVKPDEQPASACHIFTTNTYRPLQVEQFDRQNTFVRTTEDINWRYRVQKMYDRETGRFVNEEKMLSGFAAILATVRTDQHFLRQPYDTELKEEMIEDFLPSYVEWYRGLDDDCKFFEGRWTIHDIYQDYREGCEMMTIKPVRFKEFSREMRRKGWMVENRATAQKGWMLARP